VSRVELLGGLLPFRIDLLFGSISLIARGLDATRSGV
jgi:hypothetical protein